MVKPIVGFVGLSSASVGGVLLYRSLSPSQEKPLMSSIDALMFKKHKEKRLVSTSLKGTDDYWKAGWKAYLEANKESNPWNISSWSKNKVVNGQETAPDDFITACRGNSKKEVSDEKDVLYLQVLSYCTRDTLMSDLVSENSKRQALVKEDRESSDTHWVAAWKEYKKDNENKSNLGDHWKLSDWSSKNSGDNAPVTFMERCDTELKRKYYDTEGDDYKRVIAWCTRNG